MILRFYELYSFSEQFDSIDICYSIENIQFLKSDSVGFPVKRVKEFVESLYMSK